MVVPFGRDASGCSTVRLGRATEAPVASCSSCGQLGGPRRAWRRLRGGAGSLLDASSGGDVFERRTATKSASRSSISTSAPDSAGWPRRARSSAGSAGRGRVGSPQVETHSRSRLRASAKSRCHADRRRGCALGVVGVEPVRVQRGELPDQLVVAMPVRRDHRRRQPVRRAQPVHPRVEVQPLGLASSAVSRFQLIGRGGSSSSKSAVPNGPRGCRLRVIATDVVVVRLQQGLLAVSMSVLIAAPVRGRRPGPAR